MTATTATLTLTEARRVRGSSLRTNDMILINDTLIADVRVVDSADMYATRAMREGLPAAVRDALTEGDTLVVYVRLYDTTEGYLRSDIFTYRTDDIVSLAA